MVVVVLVLQYHCCLTPHTTHTHHTHHTETTPYTNYTTTRNHCDTCLTTHSIQHTLHTHPHTHRCHVRSPPPPRTCRESVPCVRPGSESSCDGCCTRGHPSRRLPCGDGGKRNETQVCVGGGSERGRIGRCRDRRVTGRRKRRQEGGMGSRTRIGNLVNAMVLSMVTSPMCVVAVIESTAIESIQSLFGDL